MLNNKKLNHVHLVKKVHFDFLFLPNQLLAHMTKPFSVLGSSVFKRQNRS